MTSRLNSLAAVDVRWPSLAVISALAVVVGLAVAGSARGVVPGSNGQIVFARQICSSDTDPCWELVVADANDAHETVVAGPYPTSVWDDHFIANWAPDAKSVIFMADLGDGQAIWQVNRDGTGMHKVFTPPPKQNPSPPFSGRFNGLDDGPAFTPDGSRIVFTRCCPVNSGYGLWSIKSDGTDLRLVTTETVGPAVDGPSDNLPQVSPDGRTIAFHRNLNGANRVVTVNIAGGHLRQLTDPAMDAQIPNWSPDGRRIAFQALGNIWAVNSDGSDLTQLTFEPDSTPDFAPSYSPDGTKIIFYHASAGQRDLYTMNADGSGITQLTHTADVSERWPQWAPAR